MGTWLVIYKKSWYNYSFIYSPAIKAIIGSFAPHGINVVVITDIRRSLSFSIVLTTYFGWIDGSFRMLDDIEIEHSILAGIGSAIANQNHFILFISLFIAPIAAKQGAHKRLNTR